jgi:hypothetical protein
MIDYARPTMLAEMALKRLHDAMLQRRYEKALREGKEALEHIADALMAIEHARKKDDA